jgi:hypothetical protein
MQLSTLLAAALASITIAAPTVADSVTAANVTDNEGALEKRGRFKGACGEYTESRYIDNNGIWPGNDPKGDIPGGGACRSLDHFGKRFNFRLEPQCTNCRFYG